MELEELVVSIKAETSGISNAINRVKVGITSLSSSIDRELAESSKYSEKAANQLKDNYLAAIDVLIDDTGKQLRRLNEEMQSISKEFGWDSPDAISIGIDSDKLGNYYEELKKIKDEFSSSFDTSDVSDSVEELQNSLDSLGETDAFSKLTDSLDIYLAKIETLNELGPDIKTNSNGNQWDQTEANIKRAHTSINKLIERFAALNNVSLGNVISQLNEITKYNGVYTGNGDTTPDNTPKSNNSSSSNKEVTKTFGTFAKAIIGVRSLYMLIRKLVNNNEYISTAVSTLINTISNVLAPVLNFLAAVIQAIAGAVARIFKVSVGTSKSASETAKNTASFDEINNIDSGSSGGGSGDVSVPSLKEAWKNLTTIEKILVVLAGLVATVFAVKGIIDFVNSLKTIKDTLAPIVSSVTTLVKGLSFTQWAGIALIITGIAIAIKGLLDYLNDPSWANFGTIIIGIGVALGGLALVIGSVPVAIAAAVTVVLGLLAALWPQIESFLNNIIEGINNAITWIHENLTTHFGIFGALIGTGIENILNWVSTLVTNIKTLLGGLFTGVKTILDGIINIFKGNFKTGINQVLQGIRTIIVSILQAIINHLQTKLNNIVNLVSNVLTSIGNKVNTKVKTVINNYIIDPLNRVIDWVNSKLHFSYGGLRKMGVEIIPAFDFQLFTLSSLPKLATGTNYVPTDMVAQLHKGEAVVPKKYNNNNEETNGLLRQLINIVDSKDFKAYISSRDVGKAAVNYINTQNRIMGGSLV